MLFNYCPTAYLDPEYRKQLVVSEVVRYNADVICLQEVDEKAFTEHFLPHFSTYGERGSGMRCVRVRVCECMGTEGNGGNGRKEGREEVEKAGREEVRLQGWPNSSSTPRSKLDKILKSNANVFCTPTFLNRVRGAIHQQDGQG